MIDVNQLRNGTAFELEGAPYLVLKYEFTKMGRGTASVRVKVRNLKTGSVTQKGFTSGAKVENISLRRIPMQYLYSDDTTAFFMDPKSFEQVELDKELIADQLPYFSEGLDVLVLFWEDQALAVELPPKLTFSVKETGPGEKGNSASNVYKQATLNNGLDIKVPLFIKQGEKVIIDTRTGEYVSRA